MSDILSTNNRSTQENPMNTTTSASQTLGSAFAQFNEPDFDMETFVAALGDTTMGYAVAIGGIAVVALSAALLTGTLLVGFWATLMLGFLSVLIAALAAYLAYVLCTSVEPVKFEELGKKAGSTWASITGFFSSKPAEPVAAPAAAI
jgi:hypothetical protein